MFVYTPKEGGGGLPKKVFKKKNFLEKSLNKKKLLKKV